MSYHGTHVVIIEIPAETGNYARISKLNSSSLFACEWLRLNGGWSRPLDHPVCPRLPIRPWDEMSVSVYRELDRGVTERLHAAPVVGSRAARGS
jgi:hypothetical protein